MTLKNLQLFVSKENRKKDAMRTAQQYALGIVAIAAAGIATGVLCVLHMEMKQEKRRDNAYNMEERIKDSLRKKKEAVKDYAADAALKASNTINDVHRKTEGVIKDIEEGYHEIGQDFNKISDKLHSKKTLVTKKSNNE